MGFARKRNSFANWRSQSAPVGDLMTQLKARTLSDENIVEVDGFFRYVNHFNKLATTGYGTRVNLIKNKDLFRFDTNTIKLMKERYDKLYKSNP